MTTTHEICLRLRAIRLSKGLSLSDVENQSHRSIRAVVLGSYERGDRNLTVNKALSIAKFYGVPLSYLLEKPQPSNSQCQEVVIDLRQLHAITDPASHGEITSEFLKTIVAFTSSVIKHRQDYNGEVISIRAQDLSAIGMSTGRTNLDILNLMRELNLLVEAK